MAVELVEQALDHAPLRQLLAVKPHRLGVGHRVLEPETQETNEGETVAQLILHLVVRQVVQLAQHDRLEHHDRIPGLAPRLRLPRRRRLAPDRFQSPAETRPRNQRIDPHERILLGIQAGIAPRHVEKPHLTHVAAPAAVSPRLHSTSRDRGMPFFEVLGTVGYSRTLWDRGVQLAIRAIPRAPARV